MPKMSETNKNVISQPEQDARLAPIFGACYVSETSGGVEEARGPYVMSYIDQVRGE